MFTLNKIFKIIPLILILSINSPAQISVEIGSGSTIDIINTINLDISGNWYNIGTFNPGKSKIVFNGSANQNVDVNGTESFFNCTVNKPGGFLKLNNDIVIQNKLELLSGNINSFRSTVTIGQGGSVFRKSGYIIGTQKKLFGPNESSIFDVGTINGYSPVFVKVTSGGGSLSITPYEGSFSKVNGTSVLQRYWTLQNDGIKKTDLKFYYLPHDISGIEANYVAGSYIEKWSFPKSEINPIMHFASVSNVNPCGDWTVGLREALSPALISLNFAVNSNHINLSWQVPSGIQNDKLALERADYWLKDWKVIADASVLNKNYTGSSCNYYDNPPAGRYLYRLRQSEEADDVQYSNEIEVLVELPGSFSLEQNFPNPFNSNTKISYSIPVDSKVNLIVYSVTGQIISELVNEFQSAGKYTVNFDASNLASGTYLYKIAAGSFVHTKKMVVLR